MPISKVYTAPQTYRTSSFDRRSQVSRAHYKRLILVSVCSHRVTERADGGDGTGKNMLGVLLMKVRDEIREKSKSNDNSKSS